MSSHAPSAPSHARVARADASTAPRLSTTRLGRPVDPEVSTTHGAGSSGAPSQARSDATA